MVDQKEEAKKEKFIETMPMMIQTHLIICKDWADDNRCYSTDIIFTYHTLGG